jgi:pimeloyl-ACP methyl ester carboxylesterase
MNSINLTVRIALSSLLLILLVACHNEDITIGTQANDYFYVEREGASMFTLVRGNTAGKVFLLIVHGGPGDSGISYSNDYMRSTIETKYAVVYSDQRDAASSQGGNNLKNLTLENMADDYKSLIDVLKMRYGNDIKIFMMAHSFGGLVSSAFMTKENYQSLIKGWIYADGAFDYPLNDSLTRMRLIEEGNYQISLNQYTEEWKKIIAYCNEHTGNFTFDESMELNKLAWKGQSYIKEINKPETGMKLFQNTPEGRIPISAFLSNNLTSYNLSKNILKTSYTNQLYKVNIPILMIYGKYDMVCPKELGEKLYELVGSTDKKLIISDVSAHSPMITDEDFFYNNVTEFIERIK